MNTIKCKPAGSLLTLVILALLTIAPTEARSQGSAIDPAATEILKRMTGYLGNLKQFRVHTQSTLEDVLGSGHRIDLDVSANVIVSRPNKIRAERKGDIVDQVFYYDGKALTLHSPSHNVYATEPAPSTFEEMFKYLYDTLGFGTPISDLVYPDAFPLLMHDVTFAQVIGKSYINGVKCDHLLFSRPGVDFQVWVTEGKRPLPRKYVVTDSGNAGLMSVVTVMSNWDVEPGVEDVLFTFVPPKDAKQINFMPF